MDETTPQNDKPVIQWPLDPVTQQSLRRWLGGELGDASVKYVIWRVLDNATFQSTGTTFGGDFRFPFGGAIVGVYAYVDTAGTTGSAVIDLNVNGSTILSTKINIDTTEKNSVDASTQPVVSSVTVSQWDILTVDIDTVQTTPAKGLTVVLIINI